jgi:hypothetical protein
MEKNNGPLWIRSGKRSFETMTTESEQVQQNQLLTHGSDESREIELPMLADVPEEVWRTVFPPPKHLSCQALPKLLHTLLYLGLSLDSWHNSLKHTANQSIFHASEVLALYQAYQLLVDAKVPKTLCKDVEDLCNVIPERRPRNLTIAEFYKQILDLTNDYTLFYVFHLPFAVAMSGSPPRTPCDIPDFALADLYHFMPMKRFIAPMDMKFPENTYQATSLYPVDERGPCTFDEFQKRFDTLSHGFCDHPAIRILLDDGIMMVSGGVILHCLSIRESIPTPSFRGRDIDLFVAVPKNSTARDALIRVLQALLSFGADTFPGKRMYITHRCAGVVDVLFDDWDLMFQILLRENHTLASILYGFDFTVNQVLYNGRNVLATMFGVQSWINLCGLIRGYSPLIRIEKAKQSGFKILVQNRDSQKTQEHVCNRVFHPPLSTSPAEYNQTLISHTFAKGKPVFMTIDGFLASDPHLPGQLINTQYGLEQELLHCIHAGSNPKLF